MSNEISMAIIGGTGFYKFFDEVEDVEVDTPYGAPSAPISIASVEGKRVAFLPRHGRNHQFLPSEVPYAANLAALKKLGVRQVVGFNTVGSLNVDVRRGDFVFCDQFIDRTSGRVDTIFSGADGAHISSADPYCPSMRHSALQSVEGLPHRFHPRGTVVVIQGPRFSTRAESHWFTKMGWDVINMTQFPEVAMARELGLCYMNLSYVTDYDVAAKEIAGAETDEIVSHAMVIREFSTHQGEIQTIVQALVRGMAPSPDCSCRKALEGAKVRR